MSQRVIICDDSSFARKQMARSLPDSLKDDVHFAEHGEAALQLLEADGADILFLDLNMPVLDGYQTLQEISTRDFELAIVVISGDIQPEARTRVLSLGAIEFIKKPISKDELAEILIELELIPGEQPAAPPPVAKTVTEAVHEQTTLVDVFQEIANVAMGQAADLLARLLDVFVILPIPKVNELGVGDLMMLLADAGKEENVSAICQGFIGYGIAGEALLIFNDSSIEDVAQLMRFEGELNDSQELELLMDISNILIGACLNGIANQLDIQFSQGHPVVLGQHVNIADLINNDTQNWRKTLAVEINYSIEGHNIDCDLLLLFTEDSMPELDKRAGYLVED